MHPVAYPHTLPLLDTKCPLPLLDGDVFYFSLAHAYVCLTHKENFPLWEWLRYNAHEYPHFYDTQMGMLHAARKTAQQTKKQTDFVVTARQRAQAFDDAFALWYDAVHTGYASQAHLLQCGPFVWKNYVPSWVQERFNTLLSGKKPFLPVDPYDIASGAKRLAAQNNVHKQKA